MSDSGRSDNKWAENTERVEEEVRRVKKTHNGFTRTKKQHNSEKSRTENLPIKGIVEHFGGNTIK